MKIFKIISIFCLAITFAAEAQVDLKSKPDSSIKENPVNISVFDGNTPLNTSQYGGKITDQDKILKINPLSITRGEIPFLFEKRINAVSSFEIGIGFTFKDYWGEAFREVATENSINETYVRPSYLETGNKVKSKIGYSLRAAYRFYLDKRGYALSDNFLSPIISYKSHKYNIPFKTSDGFDVSNTKSGNLNYVDISLVYGSQNLERNSRFALEWFAGLGYKFGVGDEVVYRQTQDFQGNSDYSFAERSNSYSTVTILMGLKLGIAFK